MLAERIPLQRMSATRHNTLSPLSLASSGTDTIIQATGVVKTYDTGTERFQALKGVDFSVARGEMVAVMGPSGCGKTTLLNCLSGLDTVDAGAITLDGSDLAKMSDRQRTDYRARRM